MWSSALRYDADQKVTCQCYCLKLQDKAHGVHEPKHCTTKLRASKITFRELLTSENKLKQQILFAVYFINLLTPNVNNSGRTAPLASKVAFYIFIQQILVLNILNMVYILHFFIFKMQFVS